MIPKTVGTLVLFATLFYCQNNAVAESMRVEKLKTSCDYVTYEPDPGKGNLFKECYYQVQVINAKTSQVLDCTANFATTFAGSGWPAAFDLKANCRRVFKPFDRDGNYDVKVQDPLATYSGGQALLTPLLTWVFGESEEEIRACLEVRGAGNLPIRPSPCVKPKIF